MYKAVNEYSTQLKDGDDYTLLNPIVALTITDFEMFPNNPDVISSYVLQEKEEFTTYSDDIKLVFVELPKFTKTVDELETLCDKWMYFLRYANNVKAIPASMGSEAAIGRAFKMIQASKLTRRQVEIVEQRQRVLHDYRNMILYAEQQGEKKGRLQAKLEAKLAVKLEIARQLLDILDVETIAQKTGFSLSEIEALRSPVE